MAQTATEKLNEYRSLRAALISDRDSQIRKTNNRRFRTREVKNAIADIRHAKEMLARALLRLVTARFASNGKAEQYIAARNASIGELTTKIAHQEQAARIERYLKLKAQFEAANAELPEQLRVVEVQEEDIVS